jgi:predicted transcriptional regulator
MKTKFRYHHPIKREILQCLKTGNGLFYGDIVRELRRPSGAILKHIMELKESGYITKDCDGGRFKLSGSL